MSTFGVLTRAGAVMAAGGLVIGLSAIPAGSQQLEPITITGEATCVQAEGQAAWAVDYTIHNDLTIPTIDSVPAAARDVNIDSATLSGAADGNPTFSPNPIPAQGDSTASGFVEGTATGVLTLTVDWTVPDFEAEGSTAFDLTLDGTCVAPATTSTSTSTTQAPAVEAVAVNPAFTG